jgi:hypothetical protein
MPGYLLEAPHDKRHLAFTFRVLENDFVNVRFFGIFRKNDAANVGNGTRNAIFF